MTTYADLEAALTERTKRPMGRPPALEPDELTLTVITGLGKIQATVKECAAVLGVGEATFLRFLDKHPEVAESFELAQIGGRASLRRHQFKLAESGNATMLIWLGKQYLEQSDKTETRLGETSTKPLRLTLTDAQLLEIASGKSGNA